MFEPFQKFIPKAANTYGMGRQVTAAEICQQFRKLMPSLLPAEAENYISPAHYKDKTLTINVQHPAWGQEVIMRKQRIIDEINTQKGQEVIKNLKIQLLS